MPTAIPPPRLDAEVLCRMIEAWPVDGYSAHAGRISPDSLRKKRMDVASSLLASGPNRAPLLWEHGELVGAASWSPLPWDSRYFGFAAARIDLLLAGGAYALSLRRKQILLDSVLRECRAEGIAHLSARVHAADLSSIHALEGHAFQLIDGIQTFTLSLAEECPAPGAHPTGVHIGEYEPWQLEGILDIARTAYRFDRFHADPELPDGAADRLHEDWLRNSCAGQAADLVMVAFSGRQVLGFVTAKFDSSIRFHNGGHLATIVLVATAERGRGRGIARATTLALLSRLRQCDIAAVQVGTQLSNIGAGRLYESCGFRLGASTLTFRKVVAQERPS